MADARIERAYAAAIASVVQSGDDVIDLGGGFGARAIRACRAGAARVITMPDPDDAHVVASVVRDNGCDDRVTIVADTGNLHNRALRSRVVVIAGPADLPVHGASVSAVFTELAGRPDITVIPQRETLYVAPVEAPRSYARHVQPWAHLAREWEFGEARRMALNLWSSCRLAPSQLLAPAIAAATIDYTRPPIGHVAELDWTSERAGTVHGLALWSEANLARSVTLGGAPGPDSTLDQVFFPWLEAMPVATGDRIHVQLQIEPLKRGYDACLWAWTSEVHPVGRPACRGRRFVQSTFHGALEPIRQLTVHAER